MKKLYEFLKMEIIDINVAHYYQKNDPEKLIPFLKHIAEKDYKPKGVHLDVDKIVDELTKFNTLEE